MSVVRRGRCRQEREGNAIELETMQRRTQIVDDEESYAICKPTNVRVSDEGFREQGKSDTF